MIGAVTESGLILSMSLNKASAQLTRDYSQLYIKKTIKIKKKVFIAL